jgi:hypothetical protein
MASLIPEDARTLSPVEIEAPLSVAPAEAGARLLLGKHRLPLALWTLLCILFFASLLFGRERLPGSDFSGQFHAFALFQAREMSQGRLPLWSPGSYAGFPFIADTQAAVFYPLRWLAIFLSLPWGFSFYVLEVEAIVHIWLAGLFTYGLAYAVIREQWPALLAAVTFALGGYLTSYPMLQLAILETIAWLPLALLLLRQAVRAARPWPWLAAAGLVLGVSALAGHPQTFLHVAYMAAVYYAYLSWVCRRTWGRFVAGGTIVGVLALGTAMAAWLPALRLLQLTTRIGVDYAFVAGGLSMLDYVQILAPGVLSLWSAQYAGIAAFFLVLITLGSGRLGPRNEAWFWAVTALVTAWLALGDAGILFRLAYYLPGFGLFRQQERLLGIFSLSLALLAAQGLAIWSRAQPEEARVLVHRAAAVLAAGLMAVAVILFMIQPQAGENWAATWWQQGVLALVVLGLLRLRRWPQQQMVALVLVLAVDLYSASLGAMNRQPGSPAAYWPQPVWLEELRSGEPARLDSRYLFHANVGEIHSLEDVHGISPLKLQTAADFEELPLLRRWQLLNVKHVWVTHPLPDQPFTLVTEFGEGLEPDQPETSGFLYRYDEARPRAWMSYQPVFVADAAAAWAAVAAADFDPATAVVLHTPEAPSLPALLPEKPSQVRIERQSSSALAIRVQTEAPGFLVLSEWAYPGWRATVNGRDAALLPANYALQAIWLPAGEHDVTLRFHSPEVIWGAVISLLSLIAGLALMWGRPATVRLSLWQFAGGLLPVVTGHGRAFGLAVRTCLQRAEARLKAEPHLLSRRWSRQRIFVSLVVLCGVAFSLRLFTLGSQELRGDEGFSYQFAVLPATEIIPALSTVGEPHSPLHYFILHAWMWLAGESELAMRFTAVVPGLLAVPLVFQVGRRFAGREFGLLLALLLALSHSQIWIGQDVRNHYTLVVFFTLLATWLLLQALEKGGTRWWVGYAGAAALTAHSHYYGVFALVAHGVYVAVASGTMDYLFRPLLTDSRIAVERRYYRPEAKGLWKWLGAGVLAAVIFAPWPLWTLGYMARQNLYDPSTPELAHYLTAVGLELTVGPAFDHWLAPWLFVMTLLLAGAGAWTLLRERPAWGTMLVTWLGLALLVIFLVRFRRSVFNDYYLTVAAPAWWLLACTGLRHLGGYGRWGRSVAALMLMAWLAANSSGLARYYTDPLYNRTTGYRAVAAHVAAQSLANDVFVAHFPDPALEYYLRHIPIAQTMQPVSFGVPRGETEAALAELAATYDRLWFVPAHHSNWDPENIAFRWLDYHNLKEQEASYGTLTLLAYRPLPAVPDVLFPMAADLDGLLRLDGLFATVNGMPAELSQAVKLPAGASLNVTLLWEALSEISDSYTVFVHLLGDDGMLIGQHDGIPLFGTRPTTSWERGERLIDRHEVSVPSEITAQGATLWVGLYHTETLARQAFAGQGEAIRVADVLLEPARMSVGER